MYEIVISVKQVSPEEGCLINRNVDRIICSPTSRQLFSQKIFPIRILFFTLKTIWAFEEWCFTDTPAFSSFFLFSQVLSGVWPSHLDLDTGVTDHEMENHCSKMLEFQLQSQNVLSFCLLCWQHGEDFKCLEAGTHPCEKCVSPLLTLPLWFPVMLLADQILDFNPVDDWVGYIFLYNVGSMEKISHSWRLGPILVKNVCHLCWPCPCGSLWWDLLTRFWSLILLMTMEENETGGN